MSLSNGRIYDSATKLLDYGARMYSPDLGRFVSADTVWAPEAIASNNAYAYTNNSPFVFTDPSGNVPLLASAAAHVAATATGYIQPQNTAAAIALGWYSSKYLQSRVYGGQFARLMFDPGNGAIVYEPKAGGQGLIDSGGGTTEKTVNKGDSGRHYVTVNYNQSDATTYHQTKGINRPPLVFRQSDVGGLIIHELGHAFDELYRSGDSGTALNWENAYRSKRHEQVIPHQHTPLVAFLRKWPSETVGSVIVASFLDLQMPRH